MADTKPIGSYPIVYDSKILNSISHTGTGGETYKYEQRGGYKYKKRRSNIISKRFRKTRKNRKTIRKK